MKIIQWCFVALRRRQGATGQPHVVGRPQYEDPPDDNGADLPVSVPAACSAVLVTCVS